MQIYKQIACSGGSHRTQQIGSTLIASKCQQDNTFFHSLKTLTHHISNSNVSLKSVSSSALLATTSGDVSSATTSSKVVRVYIEEGVIEERIERTSDKPKKLTLDLLLYKSRQSRVRAFKTLDNAERRSLLSEAEAGLRRCLSMDPSDPRAYVVLGKCLLAQRRFDEARSLYELGVANTDSANPYIWAAWGWLEFKSGNMARARELYDAATVVDPKHACAWHKWGLLEKEQGNYKRARDLWMKGIQNCRRSPQSQIAYLYNGLACMAAQLGTTLEARRWFKEGTKTTQGAASVALWQAWGVMEARQGDQSAVRYLFKKALEANPQSRYVHLAWAMWEQKARNLGLCCAMLKRGVTLNPTDAALHQAWAVVEATRNNVEAAEQLFQQGLKADPRHMPLWQAYGMFEAKRGNLDRARQLFQDGVWADPKSRDTVFIFHAWGVLEMRAGNPSRARELFRAGLRVDPKNEIIWETWINMEDDLGNLSRSEDLRIARAEQQWEYVVPSDFTTRPGLDAAGSALEGLVDTLTRFFNLRGAAGKRRDQPQGDEKDASSYLPVDFQGELQLEDVLPVMEDLNEVGIEDEILADIRRYKGNLQTKQPNSARSIASTLEGLRPVTSGTQGAKLKASYTADLSVSKEQAKTDHDTMAGKSVGESRGGTNASTSEGMVTGSEEQKPLVASSSLRDIQEPTTNGSISQVEGGNSTSSKTLDFPGVSTRSFNNELDRQINETLFSGGATKSTTVNGKGALDLGKRRSSQNEKTSQLKRPGTFQASEIGTPRLGRVRLRAKEQSDSSSSNA